MNLPFLCRYYSPRAQLIWFLSSILSGILLVLAIPVTPPGGYVERVQSIFLNLNFADLVGNGAFSFLVVLALGGLVGTGLFALSAALALWQPRSPRPYAAPRYAWVWYALPCIVIWSVYLLAFWPAMMSGDSIDQWTQVQTGRYNNAHPLLYQLSVWLLTRLWNSPSVVVVTQIILLSLVVAWGLGELRGRGLPSWAAWPVALLFAVSPVNGAMTAAMWKDVPYSTGILAFSLLVLFIVLRPETWLNKKLLWLAIGLVSIPVGLLRYNGILIAPLTLIVLALVYRRYWKVFAGALAVLVVAWWIVQKPAAQLLGIEKTSVVSGTLAFHHIAAHIHYGTPIPDPDRAMLEEIMPLDEWRYWCYLVNPVQFNPAMNKQAALEHIPDLLRLTLRLFLVNPTVDINHTFCAGSLVYRVRQPVEGYLYAAALSPQPQGPPTYIEPNQMGLVQAPLLPGLNLWLMDLLERMRTGSLSWLFWRPALYLYIFLFCGCVLALRRRCWKTGLFLLPGIIQSAVLFAVNISQAFRYQYSIYLLGLFALGLLFLPARPDPASATAGHQDNVTAHQKTAY